VANIYLFGEPAPVQIKVVCISRASLEKIEDAHRDWGDNILCCVEVIGNSKKYQLGQIVSVRLSSNGLIVVRHERPTLYGYFIRTSVGGLAIPDIEMISRVYGGPVGNAVQEFCRVQSTSESVENGVEDLLIKTFGPQYQTTILNGMESAVFGK
jgi:hypothetical protein